MELLTVKEVSEIIKMDVETIRNFINREQLKAYKIGKEWRIKQEDLDIFIKKGAS